MHKRTKCINKQDECFKCMFICSYNRHLRIYICFYEFSSTCIIKALGLLFKPSMYLTFKVCINRFYAKLCEYAIAVVLSIVIHLSPLNIPSNIWNCSFHAISRRRHFILRYQLLNTNAHLFILYNCCLINSKTVSHIWIMLSPIIYLELFTTKFRSLR